MNNPRRIVVIQLKRAGDVLVTTPILGALKRALPQTQIDFLVDSPFASLLEGNPDLHAIIRYNRKQPWKTWMQLRQARYDVILDFQSSPRSILSGLLSGARWRAGYRVTFWGLFLNLAMRRPGRDLSVTEGKMSLVRRLFPDVGHAGNRRLYLTDAERSWANTQMGGSTLATRPVGLIPTHRRDSRRWSSDAFVSLAERFVADRRPVWIFWGPGEESYVRDIQRRVPQSQLIPPTSLRQMAALLERCHVVITNDNGPMHLATSVDVPTVTLYGPTEPLAWNPGGAKHRVMQAQGLACLGCNLNDCPFGHECMRGISPEAVYREAHQLLEHLGERVS